MQRRNNMMLEEDASDDAIDWRNDGGRVQNLRWGILGEFPMAVRGRKNKADNCSCVVSTATTKQQPNSLQLSLTLQLVRNGVM
jgi:hypothetical protein